MLRVRGALQGSLFVAASVVVEARFVGGLRTLPSWIAHPVLATSGQSRFSTPEPLVSAAKQRSDGRLCAARVMRA